ncbi:MAG: AAA family ATPase [Bacteroidetes bacterium]|nr:AAA family ATPase [Bacteroidota bacterium]
MMELRKAQRKQAKIKLALQGPSGSGKTMSALLLASGITDWSKIAVIDTENHSADLYSDLGQYNVLALSQPFTPERYIKAIETCENASMEVIIIDSISQEWEGSGGILNIHGNMTGNSFTNWNKITPRHNAFVQKILQSNCHIISTIRTKQDYVLSEKNGKYIPEKVGLKGITRDGMDYEHTIVLDIDIKHLAKASKDRTGLFMDKPEEVITLNHGRKILDWCNSGISLDNIKSEIQSAKTVEKLREILSAYPEFEKELKPLAIARKEQLSVNIINLNPISGNGNGTSKSK